MRSLYVPLSDAAVDRLRELARREMRDPRSQATWLILEGLRRAGVEPELRPEEGAEPPVAKPDRSPRASGTTTRTDVLDGAG